ncbi:MAG: DNA polymerase [Chakrabartia sp.]
MLIFDLESDGLLDELTRIHTIHVHDTEQSRSFRYNDGVFADGSPAARDGSIQDAVDLLTEADTICGHNIIGFDVPALAKTHGFKPKGRLLDTMVMTRLVYPHLTDIDMSETRKGKRPEGFGKLVGSHSLKAWGIRLGVHKGDYSGGWDCFTQDMEEYAAQDVTVTVALYNLVSTRIVSEEALQLELDTAKVIAMQERFGFLFDLQGARRLEGELRGRKAELEDTLRATFPPWVEPVRKGGKPFVFIPKRDNAKLGYKAGVPVPKFKTVSFNPASRDHIANRLIELHNWEPVEFTDTGKPKVDETTLAGLDFPEAKLLIEYLTVDKRLGQLCEGGQAWLKAVRGDGRIHGRVNTLGAVTRRMTHSTPNMAQVPRVGSPYGKECRGLFIVPDGRKIVGCDAEGLELRMLAHYMAKYDRGEYCKTVVEGQKSDGTDVHTVNQKLIGLNSRDSAKTWIYAYLYGAGNYKLGSVIYDDFTEQQRTAFNHKNPAGASRDKALASIGLKGRARVEAGLPALGKLQDRVKKIAKTLHVPTLDGGPLRVRSAHAALNTLLQGGGAVVMKKALVIFHETLLAEGFVECPIKGTMTRGDEVIGYVANVHDEFQLEAPAHLADWLGKTAADSIRLAGEAFNMRCPLAGAYQIGTSWADSH